MLPEAALTGYFLEGAVYDFALPAPVFASDLAQAWRQSSGEPVDIAAGFFENDDGTYYNSALYLHVEKGSERIVHLHRKMFLPTYGVFDEERFLSRGHQLGVFDTRFGPASLLICEDAWHAIVPTIAAVKGARMLIIPSASPGRGIEGDGEGELESITHWREMLHLAAREHGIFVIYAGLTGFEGGKGMTRFVVRHRSAGTHHRSGATLGGLHRSSRSRSSRDRLGTREPSAAGRFASGAAGFVVRRGAAASAHSCLRA